MTKHFIICSAVKVNDIIIAGRRHGDALETLKALNLELYNSITRENFVAGFIDNYGDFHTRPEAWKIALAAEQVRFGKNATIPQEEPWLISEHLFDDKDGGFG